VINSSGRVIREKKPRLNPQQIGIRQRPSLAPGCLIVSFHAAVSGVGDVIIRRKKAAVVVRVKLPANLQLFEVAHAIDLPGLLLGFGQAGQKESRKNSDNRDDNQQFDQGEARRKTPTLARQSCPACPRID
jgi:hypothetical protein